MLAPGDCIFVTVKATGGSGPRATEGSLAVTSTHAGAFPDLDREFPISATITAPGGPYIMLENWTFDESLSSWGGNAAATGGLTTANGARVPGLGDAGMLADVQSNLEQAFLPNGFSCFDLEFDIAIPDFSDIAAAAPAENDRSFNLAILAEGALPGTGPFTDAHAANTIVNLLYCPAGVTGGAVEGFYLYDGAGGFQHLAALGTMAPSTGLNADGSPPDTLNTYRIRIEGRDFGTGAAEFQISVTDPGMTVRTVSNRTEFRGADLASTLAGAVLFTTYDESTDTGGYVEPTFWIDDVLSTFPLSKSSTPVTFFDAAPAAGAPKFLPAGMGGPLRKVLYSVTPAGDGGDIEVTAVTFSNADLNHVSPALPISIAPGETELFEVEYSGATAPGLLIETAFLTTNDPDIPSQAVPIKLNVLESKRVILIDYDDGIDNGIHEASIRNGGFEDGNAGDSFDQTPDWATKADSGTSGNQLTFDTDPATGSKHALTGDWSKAGALFIPVQDISPDIWTHEPGDTFTVEFKFKPMLPYETDLLALNCVMMARAPDGSLITNVPDRPIQVPTFTDTTSSYTTVSFETPPVPEGAVFLGLGYRFMLEVDRSFTDPRFAYIDDVSLVGNFSDGSPVDPGKLELVDVAFPLDFTDNTGAMSSGNVRLQWTDVGGPYTIQSDDDLDFGNAVEIAVPEVTTQSIDKRTKRFNGLIEHTFIDPNAGGGRRYYRVVN